MEDVRTYTYKARDSWWTVFLVDPVAGRLVRLAAGRVTPNQLSFGALMLGLGAAACFRRTELVAGAVLYHLSFVLDCMDGKVARLTGTGTAFGGWLDYVLDRIRVLVCAFALAGGQFAATGRPAYLYLGMGIVFLDMLRYLDALKVGQTRQRMRRELNARAEPSSAEEARDLHEGFRTRFPWYLGARDWLKRHRVRSHLVGGIEFQMAVFIIGPLTGAIIPVTVGAGVLMLAFECAIVYKLWLSSRDFARILGEIGAPE
jgi:hypothetical protein